MSGRPQCLTESSPDFSGSVQTSSGGSVHVQLRHSPVLETVHPRKPSHYRPVVLTFDLMKSVERIVLCYFCTQVDSALDPLQFVYRLGIGVDDAVLYLLHQALSHLEASGGAVRVIFFDSSCAFNNIKPLLLRRKM